jgi:cytochrome c-type biogenesis protein CcsB
VTVARFSDVLLTLAVVAYTLAMAGYAAELAFARPRRRAANDRLRVPALVGADGSDGAPPGPTRLDPDTPTRLGRVATGVTAVGWLLHLGAVVTRGLGVHRVPWGNMYEFSVIVAFAAVSTYLVLLTRSRARWLGTFVLLPVVLYLGLAGTVLYTEPGPLVPALDSYWIKIHVVAAIVSTGVFLVSGVTGGLYLLRERAERRPPAPGRGGILRRLPSAETLDRVTYGLVAFAFPVWTFAVIAGAIWAEAAWGRYWGWDPKETWSFITWVVYAGYLHARSTAGWRGRRAGWFAVAAFLSLVVNYYVVNTWIVGLHSYAGV